MKHWLVSLTRGAIHGIAHIGAAVMRHSVENHLRWSLIPDESPELTQWHGSDPYIESMLKPPIDQ